MNLYNLCKKLLLLTLFIIPNITWTKSTKESIHEYINLEEKIFADEFEDEFEHDLDGFADETEYMPHVTRQPSTSTIAFFAAQGAIKSALATHFHKRTHPLVDRSIHKKPLFQFFSSYDFTQNLKGSLFYDETYRAAFHKEETGIKHYLNFDLSNSLQRIDDELQLLGSTMNIPAVFSLFDELKVQERHIGIMFQYQKMWGDTLFGFTLPLQYLERNFFLDKDEVKRIENEPLFQKFSGDYWEFAQDHLISDKFGVGDFQFYCEHLVKDASNYKTWAGFQATIPSNFMIVDSLLGTHFDKHKQNPDFDVHRDLINPGAQDDLATLADNPDYNPGVATVNGENFLIGSLDRLSTMLLERSLGNGRHFVLGGYLRSQLFFNEKVSLTSKSSFELSTPWTQKRFYRVKIDTDMLDSIPAAPTQAQGDRYNRDISALLVDKFYLRPYDTLIFPGIILQSTSRLEHEGPLWTVAGGTDFWLKTKEKFISIHAPNGVEKDLHVDLARKPFALQNSIWISFEKAKREGRYFDFSCKFATSTLSTGIGGYISGVLQLSHDF